jgi:flagellar hook-basal body complex protein FliE
MVKGFAASGAMAEDLSLQRVELELNRLREQLKRSESVSAEGSSFGDMLKEAISEVSRLSNVADESIKNQLVSGESTDLHSTMIALEKAEVSFKLMMQIRNKILKAYEEIMRMPV